MTRDRAVLHDISMPVRPGLPEWPGDAPFECGWTMRLDAGGSVNLAHFTMSPHVGTHADAPLHVLPDGAPTDELPLDVFRGRATVLEVPARLQATAAADRALVEFADIADRLPARVERLLLRTGASVATGHFPDRWAVLTPDCIARLCDRGLRLLGVDSPSVDARHSKGLETHKALFGRGAYNLENLDLRGVPEGDFELVAYPLRLVGLDGAPVRAVLLGVDD